MGLRTPVPKAPEWASKPLWTDPKTPKWTFKSLLTGPKAPKWAYKSLWTDPKVAKWASKPLWTGPKAPEWASEPLWTGPKAPPNPSEQAQMPKNSQNQPKGLYASSGTDMSTYISPYILRLKPEKISKFLWWPTMVWFSSERASAELF